MAARLVASKAVLKVGQMVEMWADYLVAQKVAQKDVQLVVCLVGLKAAKKVDYWDQQMAAQKVVR